MSSSISQSNAYESGEKIGTWIGGVLVAAAFIASAVLWLPAAAILSISSTFFYLLLVCAALAATFLMSAPLFEQSKEEIMTKSMVAFFLFAVMAVVCYFAPSFPLAVIGLIMASFGAYFGGLAFGSIAEYIYTPKSLVSSMEDPKVTSNFKPSNSQLIDNVNKNTAPNYGLSLFNSNKDDYVIENPNAKNDVANRNNHIINP